MAGRPGAGLVRAMQLLLTSQPITPYAAAQQAGIALTTMYKAKLYKNWLAANREIDQAKREDKLHLIRIELARREVEFSTPFVRVAKKPQKFKQGATNKQH